MTTTYKHAQYIDAAEILCRHGDEYPEDGPVKLSKRVIAEVADDLNDAGIPLALLQELDERPYEFLTHGMASMIQWFSRRFRNSGGWQHISKP